MNVFQLVLKQMRQRALSTCLTLLSVILAVGLAGAIMILQRGAGKLFGQTDYGFDVLIGAKGSPLQLTLNTVYQLDRSPGNIPYSLYEQLTTERRYMANVRVAVPTAVGDTYKGQRIVATLPKFFGFDDAGQPLDPGRVLEYRPGKKYELEEVGRVFAPNKFEAVIGADIPALTGLNVGSTFQATHGNPTPGAEEDVHAENWTVTGILKKTNTSADRVIFIPLMTFYCIVDHEEGLSDIARLQGRAQASPAAPPAPSAPAASAPHESHAHDHDDHAPAAPATPAAPAAPTPPAAHDDAHDHDDHAPAARAATAPAAPGAIPGEDEMFAGGHDEHEHVYTMNPDGTINLKLPKEDWMLSAILVRSRGGINGQRLSWDINNQPVAQAVNPASTMLEFFNTFLRPSSELLKYIAYLVTVVSAVAILVSIYNSVSARIREIAILRALGATRRTILGLICLEAGLIGLVGGILGLVVAHIIGGFGSVYMEKLVGEGFNWMNIGADEWVYLLAVVALAVLAGLVPALKAYRTPVATNLVAG